MAGSSHVSTNTSFTGSGRLGDNAGSISKGISGTEQVVSKSATQSRSSVDASINTGNTSAKNQFSQGQKAAMAVISRAFRRR